jgi:NADPH:quinone reductase
VFQRTGLYTPPPGTTDIPGVEFAGVVERAGPGTRRFKAGEKVCGIVRGGGYAEYCVAPEGQVMPVPEGFDFLRAAAFPETFSTVWAAVWGQGKLKPGESLLVHGGSSGIGTTAIMWARALGAGKIFATAGSREKCDVCVRVGADRAIDYRTEDFVDVVRAETEGEGVDVVLDMVAGDYVGKGLSLLKDDGRFVLVGRMSQELDVTFNVKTVMYKRLVITGVSLRGQSVERKSYVVRQVEKLAWPLLSNGTIAPIVDTVFPLAQAADAHRLLESSRHIGKVMLQVQ